MTARRPCIRRTVTIALPMISWAARVDIRVVSSHVVPSLYTHGSMGDLGVDGTDRTGAASGVRYLDIGEFLKGWHATPADAASVAIVAELQAASDAWHARRDGGAE